METKQINSDKETKITGLQVFVNSSVRSLRSEKQVCTFQLSELRPVRKHSNCKEDETRKSQRLDCNIEQKNGELKFHILS